MAEFRTAMRSLAGAVNVITAEYQGHPAGMTATAVCSVCADPPTVLVCINRSAATHNVVSESGAFCVNILRSDDSATSAAFGGAVATHDRFQSRKWLKLHTGSPVYGEALCSLDCRVTDQLVQGTHTVFFGQIEGVAFGMRGKPLVYSDGHYSRPVTIAHTEPLPEGADAWGFW